MDTPSGRSIVRNIVWNLLSPASTLALAVFAIPPLIGRLGPDRYGALTLAWMIFTTLGLFDLGLSRALTQAIASKLGGRAQEDIPSLVATTISFLFILGLVMGIVLGALSSCLARSLLRVPQELHGDMSRSFVVLACSLPFVLSNAGLTGFLAAQQKFREITFAWIPMSLFTYLGPLLVWPYAPSLLAMISTMVAGRFLGFILLSLLARRSAPGLGRGSGIRLRRLLPLLQFGGWVTVSSIVGLLIVMFDRWLISIMISVSAVGFYATPYEAVTKLWILPGSIAGVLLPVFTVTLIQDAARARFLLRRSSGVILLILTPIVVFLALWARPLLSLWLPAEYVPAGARVLPWLAVGVLLNSVAQMPFGLLHAAGRADLTAKLHLLELPIYFLMAWRMTAMWGIEGTAIAWMIRVALDAAALFFIVLKVTRHG